MTRSNISKLVSIFTLAIIGLVSAQANADYYDHIDRSALEIRSKTRLLLSETVHYRHTPQYSQLVACTNELNRLATHIHDVTHFEGNLLRLKTDLRDLEYEFCQLEDLFDEVEIRAARGYGQIKGRTAHVKELLNAIEDCIDLIQVDVYELTRLALRAEVRPVVVTRTVAVARPSYPAPSVCAPPRPVVKTTPVFVPTPRPSVSITLNTRSSANRGFDYWGKAPTRIKGYGNGKAKGGGYGVNRNSGFSIGGGSSQIRIRF